MQKMAFLVAFLGLFTVPLRAQAPGVEMVVQAGHAQGTATLDVDEERGVFVTGGRHSVRVWRDGRLRRVLPGHRAALTRDGTRIVTAPHGFSWFGEKTPVRVFDAVTYELLRELDAGGGLRSFAVTGDGKLLLTCCVDQEIRVWRLADGRRLPALTAPPASPGNTLGGDLKVSGDSRRVAMQTFHAGVLVWDVETGQVHSLQLENHRNYRFDLSYDGRRVIAGGNAPDLLVWDFDAGGEVTVRRLQGHTEQLVHVAVSPDGRFAVTSSGDRTARLWDLDEGVELFREEHSEAVGQVAMSPSGKLAFYTVGGWGSHWIWDTETGERRHLSSHGRSGLTLPRFSEDEQVLYAVGNSRPTAWDTVTGEPLLDVPRRGRRPKVRGRIERLAISADAATLVAGQRSYLRFWDLRTGDVTTREGRGFVLAPDGSYLAVGPIDGEVELWRLAPTRMETALRHDAPIRALAGSPDGALLVTAAADGILQLWDAFDGTLLDRWQSRETTHLRLAVTAGASYVFAAFDGSRIEVWERTGKTPSVAAVLEHDRPERIEILTLSPDGRYLLSAAVNEPVFYSWDLEDRFRRRELAAFGSWVHALGFVPSGGSRGEDFVPSGGSRGEDFVPSGGSRGEDFVPSGGSRGEDSVPSGGSRGEDSAGDGTVVAAGRKVAAAWDLEGGRRSRLFEGHAMSVKALAVSGDGRQVLTGSEDATARVWDVETGAELRTLDDHAGAVTAVAWSPAGDFLATADADGTIRLWDARTTAEEPPIVRLYSGNRREWAVLGTDGRWDAAEAGRIDGVTLWDGERPWRLSGFRRGYTPGLVSEVLAERIAANRAAAPVRPIVRTDLAPRRRPPPEPVAELATVGRMPLSGSYTGMAYERPYAYSVMSGHLLVTDLSDPRRPQRVSSLPLPLTSTHSVALHGGYAYVSGHPRGGKAMAAVVDVRDPSTPRLQGTLDGDRGGSWSLAIDDGTLFVAQHDLWIYDLSQPAEPRFIERYRVNYAHATAAAGGLIYVGKGIEFGLDVVDVRDPTTPRRLASFPTRATVRDVAVDRTRAALRVGGDVVLLDVSDPRRPVETARISSPNIRSLGLRNQSLVVVDGLLGLRRFDLSDPQEPRLVGRLVPAADDKCSGGLVWTGEHWAVARLGDALSVVADTPPGKE